MKLTLKLEDGSGIHVISAYSPTMDSEDSTKETFYADLFTLLDGTPLKDRLFLFGDFNARVGNYTEI